MFLRIKKHPQSAKSTVLICHSKCQAKKVIQVVIKRIGCIGCADTPEAIAHLTTLGKTALSILRGEAHPATKEETKMIPLNAIREISRQHVGISDVFGKLYEELGFNKILPENEDAVPLKMN